MLTQTAYATVDYLSVNKITKEYYWGDDDNPTGLIGWISVPERQLDTAEDDLKKLGYTRTYYPYKIESYIIAVAMVLTLGAYITIKKVNKNPRRQKL